MKSMPIKLVVLCLVSLALGFGGGYFTFHKAADPYQYGNLKGYIYRVNKATGVVERPENGEWKEVKMAYTSE